MGAGVAGGELGVGVESVVSMISEFRERLRALLTRNRSDRELDEELAFPLEMQEVDNLRRGLSPAEARRQAHLRLGGVLQVREATRDARGFRWLDDVVADFRYALCGFVRAPGFTLAAVLGVMLVTALAAALVPARLATRVDPMVALRVEQDR